MDFIDWISDEENMLAYTVHNKYWRLPLYRLPWQVNTSNIGKFKYTDKQPTIEHNILHNNCTAILYDDDNNLLGWLAIPCNKSLKASYVCRVKTATFNFNTNHTNISTEHDIWLNTSVLASKNELSLVKLCPFGYILAADNCFFIQKLHYALKREEAREYCRLNNSTLLSINPDLKLEDAHNVIEFLYTDLREDILFDWKGEILDPGTTHLLQAIVSSKYELHQIGIIMSQMRNHGERIILERIVKNYALLYPNIHRLIEAFATLLQQFDVISIWADVHNQTYLNKQTDDLCCRLFIDQAASMFIRYRIGYFSNNTLNMDCLDCTANKSANYIICKHSVSTTYTLHCAIEYFQCKSGHCVSSARLCDGLWDCSDGGDEQGCSLNTSQDRLTSEWDVCVSGDYCNCGNYGTIAIHVSCDGVRHCSHGKDETLCLIVHKHDHSISHVSINKPLEANTGNFSIAGSMLSQQRIPDNNSTIWKNFVYAGLETALFCKDGSMFAAVDLCYYIPDAYNGCRDKSHLDECDEFNCQIKFKCHVGFCLDYDRVCDGHVDCTHGDDEDQYMCGVHVCAGRLKCHGEHRCLDLQQLCDGVQDCKYTADDEISCDCPDLCICQNTIAVCWSLHISTGLQFTSSIIIRTDLPGTKVDLSFMYHMSRLLAFDISHCNISSLNVPKHSNHIKYANISHNTLKVINDYFFHIYNKLILLDASYNDIQTIEIIDHNTNTYIKTLLLNSNQLVYLSKNVMLMFHDLTVLDIRHNKLIMIYVDSIRTIQHIVTSSRTICCLFKDIKCSFSLQEHQQCSVLFTKVQVVYLVLLAVLSLVSNLLFLLREIRLVLKGCPGKLCMVFDCSLMLSNILMCCYMCGILLANHIVSDIYSAFIVHWQQSGTCSILQFLTYLTISQGFTTFSLKLVSTFISVLRPFRCDYRIMKSGKVPIFILWICNCAAGCVLVYMAHISNKTLNYENVISSKNLCSVLTLGKLKVNVYGQTIVPFLQCLYIVNILIYISSACGIVIAVRQSNTSVITNREDKYKHLPYIKIVSELVIVLLIYCSVVSYWIAMSVEFIALATNIIWSTMLVSVTVSYSYIISCTARLVATKIYMFSF